MCKPCDAVIHLLKENRRSCEVVASSEQLGRLGYNFLFLPGGPYFKTKPEPVPLLVRSDRILIIKTMRKEFLNENYKNDCEKKKKG